MRTSVIQIFLILCVVVFATGVAAQEHIEGLEEEAIRGAVESVAASVIRFETIGGTNRVDGVVVANGPATGLVVSAEGHVISASFHFAHEPASIFAQLPNGKRASAQIVGRDLSRKLVLLKIQSDFEFQVPDAAVSEAVQVGETVIAVGRVINPDSPSISTGIISAKNRIWDRAIQTDAKISPANFGGPLLNLQGKVIGILVPMSPDDDGEMAGTEWYDSGIGFAIPFDHVLSRIDELKKGKTLRPGLIAVSLKGSDVFADPAVVAFCRGSSPAGKSGIRPGDLIVEINGRPIRRQSEMKHALGPLYENDVARLVVERDGARRSFEVELVGEIEPFDPPGIGLMIDNDNVAPMTVVHVTNDGPAHAAGIKVADRITHFNGAAVVNQAGLRQSVASAEVGSPIELTIRRDDVEHQFKLVIGRRDASIPVEPPKSPEPQNASLMEIKVAEFPNACSAVIPKFNEDIPNPPTPALLVWIPEPGKTKRETIERIWLEAARSHNVVVLVPQSADNKSWSPSESEFVVSAVNTLAKRVSFDQNRIAIGGTKTGGAMASLVAFKQRELFKGLLLVDSNLSGRVKGVATSPIEPLLILFGNHGPLDEKQQTSIDVLQKAHFPMSVVETPAGTPFEDWIGDLLIWTQAVNRF